MKEDKNELTCPNCDRKGKFKYSGCCCYLCELDEERKMLKTLKLYSLNNKELEKILQRA